MTTEIERQKTPPLAFYEQPYLPGVGDREEFETIPLLAVEAHSILVERAGRTLSIVDRLALKRISEGSNEDRVDFLAIRIKILTELGIDDDWD